MTTKGTAENSKKPISHNGERPGDPFSTLRLFEETKGRKTNLPIQPTPLINRENEFKTLSELLLREDIRLVTLTGTGGTGKTRLALEVASTMISEFSSGVFLVSLAHVTEASFVPPAIVSTLGIIEKPGKRIEETLMEFLRGKQMLLLLDNFEQAIASATFVAALLHECPRLKILVTSREPLHVTGEHELPIPTLAVPAKAGTAIAKQIMEYASVALFVQRAQAIRSDFSVTVENATVVAAICTKLDGLPLALELAAARIRVLSPDALLSRLEKRLDLLRGGPRDTPVRHQTMRNTIEWSYDLLTEEDKKLFRRLSAFSGSFSFDAAREVCMTQLESDEDALEKLERLVEKSLLLSEGRGDEIRFRMLATIREFAAESLALSSESEEITRGYADYFVALAEQAELGLRGPEQGTWLRRLESEHDNLRAALRWSLENGRTELSLRFCSALWYFWYIHGYWTEGREWIARALGDEAKTSPRLRANALLGAGTLAAFQYDVAKARSLLGDSLAISRKLGDKEGIGRTLNVLGMIARNQGDFTKGQELHEECLAIFRELGDKWGVATVLNSLGVGLRYQSRYDEAIDIHRQSLDLFREIGDKRSIARALANLGSILIRKQEYDRASRLLEESLSLYLELGDKIGIADSLCEHGALARRQRDYDTAAKWFNRALILFKEIGSTDGIATCFDEAVACACAESRFDKAARLLGASQAIREKSNSPIPLGHQTEHEHNTTTTRSTLGEKNFEMEKSKGHEMSLEEAVQYALGDKYESS